MSRNQSAPLALAYVAPFVMYVVGTSVAARMGDWYPLGYAAVVVAASIVTWRLLRGSRIIVPHARIVEGVLVGIFGIVVWIVLSRLRLEDHISAYLPEWLSPGERSGYDPFQELSQPWAVWSFITARVVGLSIVVPVVEEVFWRGFLLRWITSPDWEHVPLGKFDLKSFLGVTLLFTLAHPEWLAAACYCMLLNGLLYRTRDLWNCIVAHAVSNLLLAIYILTTGTWWLW